jgi:hypothetical protein
MHVTRHTDERLYGAEPPKLSNRQRDFLRGRLRNLGIRSYRSYLHSELWYSTVERYKENKSLQQDCYVCCDPDVDLHHRTYRRLGRELLDDLFPLCRHHQDTLHRQGLSLWDGAKALRQAEVARWERTGKDQVAHEELLLVAGLRF